MSVARLVQATLLIALLSTTATAFPGFRGKASPAFWKSWGDGKAELSGYQIVTNRYGQLRKGRAVLIYVTEDLDRRSWIKDDSVPQKFRVPVIKLNYMLKFQTGIYPYSVMTSVFSPTDPLKKREGFAPVKIAFSAQEWCGHVYRRQLPTVDRLRQVIYSYFSSEGEKKSSIRTPENTLYEDALWIQLRELDGRFGKGNEWRGYLVPSIWRSRKRHSKVVAVPATITRSKASWSGKPVTRFTLKTAAYRLTFDVELAAPRRIVHWKGSDGEEATLLKTARLPYWQLNKNRHRSSLSKLGFPTK